MNLKKLSKILGLSQTTVSRALNNYPEVSEATRERVKAAAAQHNYRANIRAKSLATGRSMAIGHVIPISTRHEIVNPIFADFIAGAGEIYSRNHHDMLLSVVPDIDEERTYRELAAKASVDGVIVHGPRQNDPRIALLKSLGIPFVVHGRTSDGDTDYSWVDVNNRRSFERAANFLFDLGHIRLGLINGLEFMDFAKRRKDGFLAAHKTRGLHAHPVFMATGEMTEGFGYNKAQSMLGDPNPPTAFIVSSMIMAIGVRRAISDAQLKMGRDISVIIHDDALSYLPNGADIPIFTATKSSVHEAGKLCAQMLLDIIDAGDQTPRHTLLETDLTLGESTGPAPK
ncbi:MAG: substrate-binding domain-containing protein [Rhodobacteraceae bacterium]|nr:substrate-binding domain-containing protein [Paracoccaceae bacterium]